MEVKSLSSPATGPTIRVLQSVFATHALPEIMVSDNGSDFTSQEFGNFMKSKGIVHITTAPYHPSSNGLAERAVQTFKAEMKRMKNEQRTLETKLEEFLFLVQNHTTRNNRGGASCDSDGTETKTLPGLTTSRPGKKDKGSTRATKEEVRGRTVSQATHGSRSTEND